MTLSTATETATLTQTFPRKCHPGLSALLDKFSGSTALKFEDDTKKYVVPIEFFKAFPEQMFPEQAKKISFKSSGTTSQDRSISYFSEDGYQQYRSNCIESFLQVIEIFRDIGVNVRNGHSLIPPASMWRDSSLARMLEFFDSEFTINYLGSGEELLFKNKPI